MKDLRNEIVVELTDCISYIEKTGFLFLPKFETAMAKTELFQEKAKSPTIQNLIILLKGTISEFSYPETKVSENWLNDFKKLLHFVKNIVPKTIEE